MEETFSRLLSSRFRVPNLPSFCPSRGLSAASGALVVVPVGSAGIGSDSSQVTVLQMALALKETFD